MDKLYKLGPIAEAYKAVAKNKKISKAHTKISKLIEQLHEAKPPEARRKIIDEMNAIVLATLEDTVEDSKEMSEFSEIFRHTICSYFTEEAIDYLDTIDEGILATDIRVMKCLARDAPLSAEVMNLLATGKWSKTRYLLSLRNDLFPEVIDTLAVDSDIDTVQNVLTSYKEIDEEILRQSWATHKFEIIEEIVEQEYLPDDIMMDIIINGSESDYELLKERGDLPEEIKELLESQKIIRLTKLRSKQRRKIREQLARKRGK